MMAASPARPAAPDDRLHPVTKLIKLATLASASLIGVAERIDVATWSAAGASGSRVGRRSASPARPGDFLASHQDHGLGVTAEALAAAAPSSFHRTITKQASSMRRVLAPFGVRRLAPVKWKFAPAPCLCRRFHAVLADACPGYLYRPAPNRPGHPHDRRGRVCWSTGGFQQPAGRHHQDRLGRVRCPLFMAVSSPVATRSRRPGAWRGREVAGAPGVDKPPASPALMRAIARFACPTK